MRRPYGFRAAPLAEGSVFAGFRVVAAVPGRELVLQGSHRFSTYALVFRLDELAPGRSRLRAETRGSSRARPAASTAFSSSAPAATRSACDTCWQGLGVGPSEPQAFLAHVCKAALVVKSATSLSWGSDVYWWKVQSALMRGLPAVV